MTNNPNRMGTTLNLPVREYAEPRSVPLALGVNEVTVVDLMRSSAARAIVDQEIPGLSDVICKPQLQPTLINVTLAELATFPFVSGMISMYHLYRVDTRLRALSAQEWPEL